MANAETEHRLITNITDNTSFPSFLETVLTEYDIPINIMLIYSEEHLKKTLAEKETAQTPHTIIISADTDFTISSLTEIRRYMPKIPIIVLSTDARQEAHEMYLQAGATHVFKAPFANVQAIDEFAGTLKELVTKQEQYD